MRIGILTSGGDCAGLNAIIRAVVLHSINNYGFSVVGIKKGTHGLLSSPPEIEELNLALVQQHFDFLRAGGTYLGTTNFGNPFHFPHNDTFIDRSHEFIDNFHALKLDALIGIGGDGSLQILRELSLKGKIPLIGIPKTIDNDLGLTESSIGFDTALQVATESLDRLQPTAASHSRIMILEVMGRDAGHIALSSGIAGGADIILIPEIPYKLENILQKIQQIKAMGRNFVLMVVAESVSPQENTSHDVPQGVSNRTYEGIGHYFATIFKGKLHDETRVTVLGHVQRGGQPTHNDRLMASSFGVHAVDLIAQKRFDRMVAWQNREVVDVSLSKAIKRYQAVDVEGTLVKTAKGLGICLG